MTRRSIGSQPRREFLKLAALSGAAAFAANESIAKTIAPSNGQASARKPREQKMSFLRVKGRDIVDSEGKKIRLRGTCPGGWMNMEDFINGHPGAEHTLRKQMAEVLGASKAQFFFDRMLDHFFNEDDVIFLREAGINVVRVPLNYRHFEEDMSPFQYKESGFTRLDNVLDLCEKHSLYVILDLHAAQGWQNVHWHSDNASRISLLWRDASYQNRYVALWKEFARRYANRSVIAGYDVLNEPCTNNEIGDYPWNVPPNYTPDWSAMNALYRRVVSEIRKMDSTHIIFLEGDSYASMFSGLDKPFDDNLAYSSHNYTAPGFGPGQYPGVIHPRTALGSRSEEWDRKKLEQLFLDAEGTRFTQENNVPLWVGEFGSVFNGPTDETGDRLRVLDDQLSIFENNGAHWTTWNYKDIGVMGMLQLNPQSPYMERINDILRKKRALGTDDWMRWLPATSVKESAAQLAEQIRQVVDDPQINPVLNAKCMSQTLLCFYAATLMQPMYASSFKGLSETELDVILASFSTKQCVANQGLLKVLGKYTAKLA